jgi:hypothetical protein
LLPRSRPGFAVLADGRNCGISVVASNSRRSLPTVLSSALISASLDSLAIYNVHIAEATAFFEGPKDEARPSAMILDCATA